MAHRGHSGRSQRVAVAGGIAVGRQREHIGKPKHAEFLEIFRFNGLRINAAALDSAPAEADVRSPNHRKFRYAKSGGPKTSVPCLRQRARSSVIAAEQNNLDTEIFDIRPSAICRDRLAINLLGKGQAGSVSKG
jgi:hypothetical protein